MTRHLHHHLGRDTTSLCHLLLTLVCMPIHQGHLIELPLLSQILQLSMVRMSEEGHRLRVSLKTKVFVFPSVPNAAVTDTMCVFFYAAGEHRFSEIETEPAIAQHQQQQKQQGGKC